MNMRQLSHILNLKMNRVLTFSLNKRFFKFENKAKRACLSALKILNKENLAVEIYLADNKTMHLLNKKLRGRDKSANVLSFNEPLNFPHPDSVRFKKIGEIWLNMDNASINFSSPPYTISNLLAHSLLHLVGYNHGKKNDRMRMEKREKMIIEKIGN